MSFKKYFQTSIRASIIRGPRFSPKIYSLQVPSTADNRALTESLPKPMNEDCSEV